jgi:hypothetical protein
LSLGFFDFTFHLLSEWPKRPIFARAHQTDIVGDFHLEYEPLNSLKNTIAELEKVQPRWWKPRGDALTNAVQYPATDSAKEWSDEILALDQYLVEGFLVAPLRELAGGRSIDPKWQSLRVLQEISVANGLSESDAKFLILPMQDLHALRTIVKGHATSERKKKAISVARSTFGSLRAHFKQTVSKCDKTLQEILRVFGV